MNKEENWRMLKGQGKKRYIQEFRQIVTFAMLHIHVKIITYQVAAGRYTCLLLSCVSTGATSRLGPTNHCEVIVYVLASLGNSKNRGRMIGEPFSYMS